MYRNKKILKSAKAETCTMRSPECNGDAETTVWCHSNMQLHGKGRGIKSSDIFGFYGCSGCHHFYDNGSATRADKESYFWPAFSRTILRLLEKGILK